MPRPEKPASRAIDKLAAAFADLDLSFHEIPGNKTGDITSYWPGGDNDVVVCAFKGTKINEPFHRQDFFFINYAYRGSYSALSARFDNLVTVREGECYIGQPYSGYALRSAKDTDGEIIILGILIKKDVFFREYLPVIYANDALFRFFTSPRANRFSDEFIHLPIPRGHAIRTLLDLMAVEYAESQTDTQIVLKSLLQTLLLEIARLHRLQDTTTPRQRSLGQILSHIKSHSDTATLKDIARDFGYHPNYVSALIHKETGKTFSQILLEARMERAVLLMRGTTLSLEEIARMLGYPNPSNFYKAFKGHYGTTPRAYLSKPERQDV